MSTDNLTAEDILSVWEAMSAREAYWALFDITVEDDGRTAYPTDERAPKQELAGVVVAPEVAAMPRFLFNCLTAYLRQANDPTPEEVEMFRSQLELS